MSLSKRKDLVFGLHFDFHANLDSPNIGENFTEEMVQEIIDKVHPEFIQCDCKGHPGISSYPTKVGNPALKIKKDILKIWRDVTEKNDIPLFVHYSGVFDAEVLKTHPDWRVICSDGTEHPNATNLFCDYAESFMIPQLLELAGDYKLDGVWIDGDCWGVLRDCGEKIKKLFTERTGITVLPNERGDKGFDQYLEILRELYRNYLNNYTKTLHSKYPDFQIASNWAYSSYMPEKAEADVDFLSGDIYGNDMINLAQYEAKYLANQDKPWDLMSWNTASISAHPDDPTGGGAEYRAYKTTVQLKQEASQVLAHGGGFQIYFMQEKDGSVNTDKLTTAKDIYEFCSARKPFCFRGKQKSEIAVFFSTEAAYGMANEAFGFLDGTLDFLKGNVSLMSSFGLPVDVVSEHNLNLSKYSLIVIPEWEEIPNKKELLEFVNNGGNLLILGSRALSNWQNELGISVDNIKQKCRIAIYNDNIMSNVGTYTNVAIINESNAKTVDYIDVFEEENAYKTPSAVINKCGNGQIAGVCFDTGLMYKSYKDIILSDLIKKVTDMLLPDKKIDIKGSRYVATTLYELNGKLCVGLLNVSGPHSDPNVLIYDEIPQISELTVSIKCEKPNCIYREPQHIKMPFVYENKTAQIKVKDLELFDIIVIE